MKPFDFCKNCNGLNENGEFKNRLICLLSCGKYASEFVKKFYDESKVDKGCSTCKNCEHIHKYPSYMTAEECVCTVGLECDTVLFSVKNCPKWVRKFESEEIMKNTELKLHPCYCGGEMEIKKVSQNGGMDGIYYNWKLSCSKCGLTKTYAADGFYGREYKTLEEAVDDWNKNIEANLKNLRK